MRVLTVSKILLILIVPFLIFLAAANQIVLDKSYYAGKIAEYGIDVPEADFLNEKTIDFVSGKNGELPDAYNEREKQHLIDVRNAVKISKIVLYFLTLFFISLFFISSLIIKINNNPSSFIGIVFAYGGLLTIGLAALLFLLINLDFSSTFDSFHILFFRQGTYTFDPAKEIIVNLYPEQFFMDLGLKILKWVLFVSALSIIIGIFLITKTKNKKN